MCENRLPRLKILKLPEYNDLSSIPSACYSVIHNFYQACTRLHLPHQEPVPQMMKPGIFWADLILCLNKTSQTNGYSSGHCCCQLADELATAQKDCQKYSGETNSFADTTQFLTIVQVKLCFKITRRQDCFFKATSYYVYRLVFLDRIKRQTICVFMSAIIVFIIRCILPNMPSNILPPEPNISAGIMLCWNLSSRLHISNHTFTLNY